MSKYDNLKILKETKARVAHTCSKCGRATGEIYYSEKLRDRFLHSLHEKKFCKECYEKFGDNLLNPLVARPQINRGYKDTPLFRRITKKEKPKYNEQE